MAFSSATFLATDLADELAEHVKLEVNITLRSIADFDPWFRTLNTGEGKLHRVDVFTHASMPEHLANCPPDSQFASCGRVGAYGLIVARKTLNLGAVGVFGLLRGAFSAMGTINLRACGIAGIIDDPKSRDGPAVWSGNGLKFCQAISDLADCIVRASPAFQLFTVQETTYLGLITGKRVNFDPGPWEGPVFIFEPGQGYRVESPG